MPNLSINFGGNTIPLPGVYVYGNVTQSYVPPTPVVRLFLIFFKGMSNEAFCECN